MLYSVLQIAGHQYRVQAGDVVDVQKLNAQPGDQVNLDQVLFIGDHHHAQVGTPLVAKAKVCAHIISQGKGRKITVFKRRPGLWQKKRGHRQCYTSLLITEIDDGQGNVSKIDQDSKTFKKYLGKTLAEGEHGT